MNRLREEIFLIYSNMKECVKCLTSYDLKNFLKDGNICDSCIKINKREYYSTTEWKEYRKEYRRKNKEKLRIQKQEWVENNRDKINETQKRWRENNKEVLSKKVSSYIKQRKKDPIYKLKCNIGCLIRVSFIRNGFSKRSKIIKIIGCTFDYFKGYIESKFTQDMNWDNHGLYWHIDHIIPVSWANSESEILKLNHYSNFQPLKAKENQSKGNRYSG